MLSIVKMENCGGTSMMSLCLHYLLTSARLMTQYLGKSLVAGVEEMRCSSSDVVTDQIVS